MSLRARPRLLPLTGVAAEVDLWNAAQGPEGIRQLLQGQELAGGDLRSAIPSGWYQLEQQVGVGCPAKVTLSSMQWVKSLGLPSRRMHLGEVHLLIAAPAIVVAASAAGRAEPPMLLGQPVDNCR